MNRPPFDFSPRETWLDTVGAHGATVTGPRRRVRRHHNGRRKGRREIRTRQRRRKPQLPRSQFSRERWSKESP